jgi:DNA repair protein RAD16
LGNPLPPAALNAFQRAKNLRNSEFSLNPVGLKRKRFISDDKDDDDSDNSPDAQIAKALQAEENAKINTFLTDDADELTPRRARRALRTIRPKADYVSDFSDDEPDIKPLSLRGKPSLSGGSSSKKTSASWAKRAKVVEDSEESEFVNSDSEDKISLSVDTRSSSEIPLASSSGARKVVAKTVVVKQETSSLRGQGSFSRGRGRFRGGSRTPNNRTDFTAASTLKNEDIEQTNPALTGTTSTPLLSDDEGDELTRFEEYLNDWKGSDLSDTDSDDPAGLPGVNLPRQIRRNVRFAQRWAERKAERRAALDRSRLEAHHPELLTMWKDLEDLPAIKTDRAPQPANISRELKPFQLEGLSWMQAMEKTAWGGGLLGDEMGMGKTIQAVSLIMSDYPAKNPSLVLIPPVALMQWQQEIGDYTDGTLKTFVFHSTNKSTKGMSVKELKKYDVILMSYNSLESMFRHQEKGFKRKEEQHFQKSVIHQIHFHRVILDEAHNIKVRILKRKKNSGFHDSDKH